MASVELLVNALDSALWEMSEAFKGLQDEDVWRRPAPQLLSIGELAAHVAYWESFSFLGEGYESPLTSPLARYYTSSISEPLVLELGAEAVFAEVQRIHAVCKAVIEVDPRDADAPNPLRGDWTWGYTLTYQAFHFGYHAGQMYTVRHLLSHETVDN